MRNRDYHKKQFVRHGSKHHWRLYQAERNRVNIEMRKSKLRYYRQKIGECDKTDPKTTWKLMNSLTGRASKSSGRVNEIEIGDTIIYDDENISESFNDFFINIGPKLASELTKQWTNKVDIYLKSHADSNIPSFRFMYIPVEKVLKTLRHLKISKSTGLDKIPAKMLRIASGIIVPSLTFIFNLSLSTGVFVDDWKNARVRPVAKGGLGGQCPPNFFRLPWKKMLIILKMCSLK